MDYPHVGLILHHPLVSFISGIQQCWFLKLHGNCYTTFKKLLWSFYFLKYHIRFRISMPISVNKPAVVWIDYIDSRHKIDNDYHPKQIHSSDSEHGYPLSVQIKFKFVSRMFGSLHIFSLDLFWKMVWFFLFLFLVICLEYKWNCFLWFDFFQLAYKSAVDFFEDDIKSFIDCVWYCMIHRLCSHL